MSDFSFIANAHPAYIDSLYEQYQNNPEQIEGSWASFFKGFDYAHTTTNGHEKSNGTKPSSVFNPQEFQVLAMVTAYRGRGHLLSTTNPVRPRVDRKPKLDITDFNLSDADLDTVFYAAMECGLDKPSTLRDILSHLKRIYCGNIGFEFQHIQQREKRRWLRTRVEQSRPEKHYNIPLDKKRRILEKLNEAVGFEKFLHTKYIGQKRFSLEGGESTIVGLDAAINKGAEMGVKEVIIGMAHRGRLNVLANIMKKTYQHIFTEFEGTAIPDQSFGDGDVKYHLGYSSQVVTSTGKDVQLELTPNPSHLEAVNPVVEGYARAKADRLYQGEYDCILPILIHGDAAIAGQGIVYEVAQMSNLKGYYTGGTFHFVINNQIGFTTDFDDARSSTYCTGVASVISAPVFHVNGDDPEALLYAVEMAMEYRQEFNSDVFIDMLCYRKHGHNEGDDPMFTQPDLYQAISVHPNPREIYMKELVEMGELSKQLADDLEKTFWANLQARLDDVKERPLPYNLQEPEEEWKKLRHATAEDFLKSPATGIEKTQVEAILNHLNTIPSHFRPIPKVSRLLENNKKLLTKGLIDWATAELMAYASILMEGKDVRMSGQDVKRGTFSHRHAVLRDAKTTEELNRLDNISENQGKFRIYNSLLSEFAVMGFEFGYSLADPHNLVIWEAQFGDFFNGAQTIIDQFISAGESKWHRMSGLTLLLPHGYEGQGPEHSSARLERFLQSCADLNMVVTNISSPANFFHLLRRQQAWEFRKPLVVMSPKSLLRHPECVSPVADFEIGKAFQEVIDDPTVNSKNAKNIKRLLFCSGKIYYDLAQRKRELNREDVAIVRVEQLYPLPENQLAEILKRSPKAEIFWVQEESANMGAWQYMKLNWETDRNLQRISRRASASPAVGFKKIHDQQQENILQKAFVE
ncbi:2-oxoglutarate dehydrogenase E1 component [Haliscomenobacter sp.]|uniref:2-oxoglutarate dehydrogenase E1 component n=1 Tax=Haliscomenobacter sp. TaxID=2717303 RepID=UPI00359369E7